MSNEQYEKRVKDITRRGQEMTDCLLTSVTDLDSGGFIQDRKVQEEKLTAASQGTIYEGLGKSAPMVLASHSRALQRHVKQSGEMPSMELLASSNKAIENVLALVQNAKTDLAGTVYESAGDPLSTSEGIIMRDRMVALILPVQLQMVTSNMVTHIPGDYNRSEMFKVQRVAGSTFGELTKGDVIDYDYNKTYSTMDQRWTAPSGDGTVTGSSNEFDLVTTTVFGTAYPIKRKSVRIYHDHSPVATDTNGDGQIYGTFTVGEDSVSVTGTVDYTTGVIHPVFSVAPAADTEIHIGYDVDIEKEPTLIPKVDHIMNSATLFPHESAIAGDVSLQALWSLRRELSLNSDNMTMQAMRNLLAADKDRKILKDLYYFSQGSSTWDMTVPDGISFREHYETVLQTLLEIDSDLVLATGFSGLVGIVADPKAVALFRSLGAPHFQLAPGYRKIPQPHRVGKLFGWDVYEDPAADTYSALCFAKGSNHGEAGYVAGDAIPALSFKHSMMPDLVYKNTMWELGYRDLNPFYGRKCFTKLVITTA